MARPTKYRPEFARQARILCAKAAATDKELAEFFGVTEQTINNWKQAHPEFLESLKDGKGAADDQVEASLFQRAIGYRHDAVKILTVADGQGLGSHVEQVPYVEQYPPDTTAAIFWLKNRRPDQWREKQQVEHSGTVTLEQILAKSREGTT